MTFLGVGVCAALIGVLVWLIVTDDPPGVKYTPRKETLRESIAGIWQVIRTPSMGRRLPHAAFDLSELRAGCRPLGRAVSDPHLRLRSARAAATSCSSRRWRVLGSFFWGPSERLFGRYKVPVMIGAGICFASLVLLAAFGTLPVPLLLVVFAMIGFSTGMVSVLMSHGRSLVAPHLLGRTITLLNIGTMGGGFLVQFVSGAIIDLFPVTAGAYPLEAYRLVFGLQAAVVLVGFVAYFGSRESHLGRS